MPIDRTLKITTPSDTEIVMTREFAAPRQLLYDAHTKPELVKRWLLGPDGWTMPVCEIDLRVGGRYRYVWRKAATGAEMATGGRYLEVVEPERLASTEQFEDPWYEGEAINTIVLVETESGTILTQTMRLASKEARDGIVATGMATGVATSYDRLERILAEAA
ncbi:MAG: SRPBCC family protein [Thermoanaerobaculia bacterium]